jgi:hypothetical protein
VRRSFLFFTLCALGYFSAHGQPGQPVISGGDSWAHIKANKKGTLVIYWYEAWPFIWSVKGNIKGIECEIIIGLRNYLKTKYRCDIKIKYAEGKDFEETYNTIRDKHLDGFLGACSFSITRKEKKKWSLHRRICLTLRFC